MAGGLKGARTGACRDLPSRPRRRNRRFGAAGGCARPIDRDGVFW